MIKQVRNVAGIGGRVGHMVVGLTAPGQVCSMQITTLLMMT